MEQWIEEVQAELEQIPYGEVSFSIKRHAGNTTRLFINGFPTRKTKGGTREAGQYLLQLLQQVQESKYNGSLTFTLSVRDGEVGQITEQNVREKPYDIPGRS